MATRDASAEGDDMRLELGKRVEDRRLELGLSVRAAADLGSVARGTWTALEEGARKTASNNYAGVERALGWEPGSIKAILAGGEPTKSATQPDISDDIRRDLAQRRTRPVSPASPGNASTERDEALRRVMLSDLPDDQKRRIVKMLIDEQRDAERRRVERAEQLIRFARGED